LVINSLNFIEDLLGVEEFNCFLSGRKYKISLVYEIEDTSSKWDGYWKRV